MNIVKKLRELKEALDEVRTKGVSVGFVPTMGSLHEGHLSLIRQAKQNTQYVVASIFVNPTQFGESRDYEMYPHTYEKDEQLLRNAGTDLLFYPDLQEIYPGMSSGSGSYKDEDANYTFGPLEQIMEGEFRKGHFQGVAQVVAKLLRATEPCTLFLGQKDYQQYLIIKSLIDQISVTVEVELCPIIREENGLAMSSRNVLLTEKERAEAGKIHEILKNLERKFGMGNPGEASKLALEKLELIPSIKNVEYVEIVNANNLQRIDEWNEADKIIACIAVRIGEVRLIDNVILVS
ncbi:MAG: pantoate--beta-alanine ligase [Bacteroidetes bacterium]|nr:pantoate--beta-alanine ligase [Bacteroidota bacterium]